MSKYNWESESLKWIHEIREKQHRAIQRSGKTLGEWLRTRKPVDVGALARKLGLKNVKIVPPPKKHQAA